MSAQEIHCHFAQVELNTVDHKVVLFVMIFISAALLWPSLRCCCCCYLVFEAGVTVGVLEQHPCNLGVTMLTGTHECGRAVVVLHVRVGAAVQKHAHHRRAPMTDRQHQSRLPCLDVSQRRQWGGGGILGREKNEGITVTNWLQDRSCVLQLLLSH